MNAPRYPELEKLRELNACREGYAFALRHNSWQECWDVIPRGDWSLWVLGKIAKEEDRKRLVLIAYECARVSLPIFEKCFPDDKRVRECIETTEKWARGEAGVTIEDVRKAQRNAAAYAAYAADAAAYAAAYAAAAAAYAADADAAADAADARSRVRAQTADIVRKYYPKAPALL